MSEVTEVCILFLEMLMYYVCSCSLGLALESVNNSNLNQTRSYSEINVYVVFLELDVIY